MNRPAAESRTPKTVAVLGLEHVLEKAVYQAQVLEPRGWRYTFLVNDYTGRTKEIQARHPKLAVEHLPDSIPARLLAVWRWLRRNRPHHIELYLGRRTAALYAIMGLALGIPTLVFERGSIGFLHQRDRLTRLSMWGAYRLAKTVVYKELHMPEAIKSFCPPAVPKLRFLHNAVPVPSRPAQRAEFMLFLNRVVPPRNLDMIIEAMAMLKDRVPHAKLLIVGFKPCAKTEASEYELHIKKQVAERGLSQTVECIDFTTDTEQYYKKASVFVFPADFVFINYSLLEAMSRGVPAIIADVEGADLLIEDHVSGLIIERQAEALAAAMEHLMTNEEIRRSMGEAARKTIINKYGIQAWADKLEQILAEL